MNKHQSRKRRATIALPEGIWLEAKKAALDRGIPFQDLVAESLRSALLAPITHRLSAPDAGERLCPEFNMEASDRGGGE